MNPVVASAVPVLRDVLPSAIAAGGGWIARHWTLPQALLATLGDCDAQERARLLCAALALAEARLTGGVRIQCNLVAGGPLRRFELVIDDGTTTRQCCDAVAAAPEASPDQSGGGDADWAISIEPVSDPRADSHSVWCLLGGDQPGLYVGADESFSDHAMEILASSVLRLLPEMLASPDAPLVGFEMLGPQDLELQLRAWNDTARSRSLADTVHGRFLEVARQHADDEAVVDAKGTFSYRALQAQASSLAQALRQAGAGKGDMVAVAMARSRDAIAAVLAILEIGAAYLPLDAAQPGERLAFMLGDSGAKWALLDAAHAKLALPAQVQRIVTTDVRSVRESAAQGPVVDGDALAYVMYTSGSTGMPKGVQIRHRSILRLVRDAAYLDFSPEQRWLHAAPLGFDASTLEIWGALLNGGCVVVHDEAVPTAQGLHATISRHGVTSAWLTSALFNAVVDADPKLLAGLRQLITGGEALSVDHVRRMRRAMPGVRLHNGYGPTECTTFTCTYPIPEADAIAEATSIPIGRPIADTRVYILNPRRQLLPIGAIGELYVGGEGLARGYLGRPELTAKRFVPDPFVDGERLYRTGDLVRYRNDGVIEFIGRADDQVKIRGYRIEPGEIEAALAAHPGVTSCAVLARADRPGDKQLVAYFVAQGAPPSAPELRAFLAARLPEFMLPVRYLPLDALPVTSNGKLDRRALPAPDRKRPELAAAFEPAAGEAERALCGIFAELLDIEDVGRFDNFFELGGNSLLAVRLMQRLRSMRGEALPGSGRRIDDILVFAHPTPAALAGVLQGKPSLALDHSRLARTRKCGRAAGRNDGSDEPIAIIAMAGRFPGAGDVEAFWRNLCEGRESITYFAADQLDPAIGAEERADPAYVAARGVVEGIDRFDAAFFGIGPREAELMDPQQRVFLELCWECMERGGHVPGAGNGPVGIFAGMYNASYFQRHVMQRPDLVDKVGAFQVMLGNEKDYIATRVAHKLGLTGPSVSVHTACSTSLVAICQALESLQRGNCDMALAGGVTLTCPPNSGYRYQEGAMLSPDGHTRTFDADAKGTVFSDGAAVVLLKRLSDAQADGDEIVAVIRGGAVNNDGSDKASFTAPSAAGQAAVVAMAHDNASVDARSIGYVETHGTATPLGDPIEIEGLTAAFRRSTDDVGFCRVGSVKSNVGHLVIAAGATGVIKTALALREGRIPASLHYQAPNPAIDFANSPFVVNAAISDWPESHGPRRAGVSSFGVGGTNAHVVMEQAPPQPDSEPAEGVQLLVLSARTPAALSRAAVQLGEHLEATPMSNLADVAWTLAAGRKAFAHRLALVAKDAADAAAQLHADEVKAAAARSKPAHASDVVFLFPGQGAQYSGMGRALYAVEPAFKAAFDDCVRHLRSELGFDLREVVFGDDADALLPTAVMQPSIFAIEYSLARLWMGLGLQPAAMIGHSVGEFVAATLAGVFALPDALRLVARRGAMMQAQPPGAMLSVRAPFDDIAARLPEELSMAAENAPGNCVVAGPFDAVQAFQAQLDGDDIACRPLRTSHAFHSSMMEDVVAPFRAEVAAVARNVPTLPIVSSVSGQWLDAMAATSAEYWARHLREPVRFSSALAQVFEDKPRTLLEVGPRTTLSTLVRQHPQAAKQQISAVASLADAPAGEVASLRMAAGQLWSRGAAIDPAVFDRRTRRRRACLPTYPFERQRFWVDAAAASGSMGHATPLALATFPAIDAAVPVDAPMPAPASTAESTQQGNTMDRKPRLIAQLKDVFEDVAGFDLADADPGTHFIELGLDSLMLTQVALQLQRTFSTRISFRQLMGDCATLDKLASHLDSELPAEAPVATPAIAAPAMPAMPAHGVPATAAQPSAGGDYVRQVIDQQMQLMAQQLALLSGGAPVDAKAAASASIAMQAQPAHAPMIPKPQSAPPAGADGDAEEAAVAHTSYDVKKAFGAIARIDNSAGIALSDPQRRKLEAFIEHYVARTRKSKDYTQAHRAHMADPRVVNGFKPLLKEMIYQIVIERSKGSQLWDIDGNQYVDALNGFGMSLFGWQPDFVLDAIRSQLELGYEIGPQHPLAGEVSKLVCEVTGHDRAALCNTGSEAVLGALRIARTVTGRETVVVFNGAYHGIIDEMIVRGTKKLRAVPAAPGILRNTAEHVLVLDYGTPESLQIIRERAHEIAVVLVEPVQSRRPDFQPRRFLEELRQVTTDAGALLVFDEVVTGFRAHPGGAQAVFGIHADLATYGKVVGGGYPIGVIAGKRDYMDALDGGHWQYGDDSVPTVGVTYFAGTFVRHPLALAAAKAVLQHIKAQGPQLQERLNARTGQMAAEMNAFCAEHGAPVEVRHFASVWKTFFLEEHPLQDLLFAMMRSRGIHILDNFPCFLTTAHGEADFQAITRAFCESVAELQEAGFLPRSTATSRTVMDPARPLVAGARIGRDPEGRPGWYVADPKAPDKYRKVG